MRLYEITSTPVDGFYTVAHVWAGNVTLAQEHFASVYPDLKISGTHDVFSDGKPGLIAERFSVDPPPEPLQPGEHVDLPAGTQFFAAPEPKRRKRGE